MRKFERHNSKLNLKHHTSKAKKEMDKLFCQEIDRDLSIGVKGFIWHDLEDSRVCKQCRAMNGKKFDRSEADKLKHFCKKHKEPGCRCYVEAIFA